MSNLYKKTTLVVQKCGLCSKVVVIGRVVHEIYDKFSGRIVVDE